MRIDVLNAGIWYTYEFATCDEASEFQLSMVAQGYCTLAIPKGY